MTTFHDSQHVRPILTPQEAIARDLIIDQVARQHRVARPVRRHTRTALALRRLAARLDPEPEPTPAPRQAWKPVRHLPASH
ncbi:MAG TPA: hypothetical protein VFY88_00600 [Intrasporangium sp.]|nr:hypothetical protein [Intrasporangium sp.]